MTVRRGIAATAFLVKRPLTGSGCCEPVKGRIRVSKESSMFNSREKVRGGRTFGTFMRTTAALASGVSHVFTSSLQLSDG